MEKIYKYYISRGDTSFDGRYKSHTIEEVVHKDGEVIGLGLGMKFKLFNEEKEAETYIDQNFSSSRLRRKTGQDHLAEHQIQRVECIKGAFGFYLTPEESYVGAPAEKVAEKKEERKQVTEIVKKLPKDKIIYQDKDMILTNEKVHEWQKPAHEGYYVKYIL